MKYENEMKVEFDSLSNNERFARVCVAAFVSQLDPTVDEIADIKTAVSEAVTNAIIHGYEDDPGKVTIYCKIVNNMVYIQVDDHGKGIANIEEAMAPLYTSKPDQDRSGMGFTVMETFMDSIEVESEVGRGTTVTMKKTLRSVKMEEGRWNE